MGGEGGGGQRQETPTFSEKAVNIINTHTLGAEYFTPPPFFLHAPSNTALHFKHVVNSLLRIT